MSEDRRRMSVARRSFLSRLSAGAAAFGIIGGAQPSVSANAGPFQPAAHPQDDWLDQIPGKHRLVLDTISPEGADIARRYTENFFVANKEGYGLDNGDLAVVIVLRHFATPFAYNDAVWAKYGGAVRDEIKFTDPKTNQPATTNVYNTGGLTLDGLAKRGVRFAVCGMATQYFAGVIARKAGASAEAVTQELIANLIGSARMVPAGIVTVNRAQERGYAFS